jgi:hypothetical protein
VTTNASCGRYARHDGTAESRNVSYLDEQNGATSPSPPPQLDVYTSGTRNCMCTMHSFEQLLIYQGLWNVMGTLGRTNIDLFV